MGVERVQAQSQDDDRWTGEVEQPGFAPVDPLGFDALPPEEVEAPPGATASRALAGLLVLLALGWLGLSGYALSQAWPGASLVAWTSWASTVATPLILIALVWLIFGRSSRRETMRFTQAVAAMRQESHALESVLAIVGGRIEENRSRLSEEAARLMALGDEASDRLGRVTHYIARETAELDRKALALDNAAASARVDIGVLISDLPRAEEQARAAAEAMKAAGLEAHERAAALDGQLAALTARSREADETVGSAAQRLGAHIARVESSSTAAAERMDQAAAQMNAAVDGAMARASDAVEQTRSGLEAQGQTMLALIEQSRAAFEQAGAETSRRLTERLELARSGLEAQGQSMLALVEQSRAAFEEAGAETSRRLDERLELARSGLEAQGQSLLALVEQSRAAFEEAGAETSRSISERLEQAGATLETLAGRLAEQEVASRSLVAGLTAHIASLDEQLAALGRSGDEQNARLVQSIATVRESAKALRGEIEQGHTASGDLTARAQDISAALDAVRIQLRNELPTALADVEAQAGRTAAAAAAMVPSIEAAQAAAALTGESLGESEASVARQRAELDALVVAVRDGLAQAEERLRAVGAAVSETDGAASRLVQETGPHLIDALVRVREAANQAANHAREAIMAAIPDSVAALADASREALSEAVTEPVQDQLAEIAGSAQRAMAVARQASERLTRQLLVMSETAAAIEDRIAEDRAQRDEREAENLTRRVSLLIEALNSTAIDVNKLLSNEVDDSAWAAYLKGDRGVFTRRAVRLLDSGEAREIARHYEEEPDFREQVNRYIHDFDAMLRRVLADREGTTLGVTLLSSDMGKLYVALGQAVERTRR